MQSQISIIGISGREKILELCMGLLASIQTGTMCFKRKKGKPSMFSQKGNFSKEMELQGHNIDTREEHASSSLIASGSGLLGVLME